MKNKYRIIPNLFGVRIIRLNLEDGTENTTMTYNAFEELTDEELDEMIELYKNQIKEKKNKLKQYRNEIKKN